MSITVNGQSRVPPGFRFHPTEEELLNYYLRKKVASEKIDLDVICDVDLNKLEPWDIQEKCRIGSTPPNDWYFFSHKDKKYPTGTRTNRATVAGFWKATGRDKVIYSTYKRIGMRKTLVFYKGRAPHGQKSDWIMHEYRLDEQYSDSNSLSYDHSCSSTRDASAQEDGWVVCRVFKKKNFHKATDHQSPNSCDAKTQLLLRNPSSSDGALDQILEYMGRSCKHEAEAMATNNRQHLRPIETVSGGCSFSGRFMKLPAKLDNSPTDLPSLADVDFPMISVVSCFDTPSYQPDGIHAVVNASRAYQPAAEPNLNDWAALDRLIASHLNGDQPDAASKHQLACLDDVHELMLPDSQGGGGGGGGSGDGDLWSLASSASDHIGFI